MEMTQEHKKKLSDTMKGRYTGSNNPKWAGGNMVIDGYIYSYKPKHNNATKLGYVAKHRLVMEEFLGRELDPNEVVHHEDGNRQNNCIENLKLFPNLSEHMKYHNILRRNISD